MEPIMLFDGRVLQVHNADDCYGPACCIHRPSDHPLNTAPLDWWQQIGVMYRRCPHGHPHPDPDDMAVKHFSRGLEAGMMLVEAVYSTHISKCDGCCQTPTPPEETR